MIGIKEISVVCLAVSQFVVQLTANLVTPGNLPIFHIPEPCDIAEYRGLYGIVLSSQPQETYLPNIDCTLRLKHSSANFYFNITFLEFDLEPPVDGECQDYVQFFNGKELSMTERLCGGTAPPSIVSNGSEITIIFRTNHVNHRKGFKLLYSRVKNPDVHTIHPLTMQDYHKRHRAKRGAKSAASFSRPTVFILLLISLVTCLVS